MCVTAYVILLARSPALLVLTYRLLWYYDFTYPVLYSQFVKPGITGISTGSRITSEYTSLITNTSSTPARIANLIRATNRGALLVRDATRHHGTQSQGLQHDARLGVPCRPRQTETDALSGLV
jgi:hypothetical protein